MPKFTWDDADFQISDNPEMPDNLAVVVSDAPKDPKDTAAYILNLLDKGKITVDEVQFLFLSGAFQDTQGE